MPEHFIEVFGKVCLDMFMVKFGQEELYVHGEIGRKVLVFFL